MRYNKYMSIEKTQTLFKAFEVSQFSYYLLVLSSVQRN